MGLILVRCTLKYIPNGDKKGNRAVRPSTSLKWIVPLLHCSIWRLNELLIYFIYFLFMSSNILYICSLKYIPRNIFRTRKKRMPAGGPHGRPLAVGSVAERAPSRPLRTEVANSVKFQKRGQGFHSPCPLSFPYPS